MSTEAIIILLYNSDLQHCQDPISYDKIVEMVIDFSNKIFGQHINTCCMDLITPQEFICSTIHLIQVTWKKHRNTFIIHEAKRSIWKATPHCKSCTMASQPYATHPYLCHSCITSHIHPPDLHKLPILLLPPSN